MDTTSNVASRVAQHSADLLAAASDRGRGRAAREARLRRHPALAGQSGRFARFPRAPRIRPIVAAFRWIAAGEL